MTITLSETLMHATDTVELWFIRGDGTQFAYPTKYLAETAARFYFPHEDTPTRYARIYFVIYHRTEQ